MLSLRIMVVQIATFARVDKHIINVEKKYRSEALYIITTKDKIEGEDKQYEAALKRVNEFYSVLGITPKITYVDFNNINSMVVVLGRLIKEIPTDKRILLNVSGARRSTAIALIMASLIIRRFEDREIKGCFIPELENESGEVKHGEPVEFDILPSYIPDRKDLIILNGVKKMKKITKIAEDASMSQPNASVRLINLTDYGYVISYKRNRELTEMGKIILEIFESEI